MSANSALLGKGCEFEKDLKVFKALYPSLVLQLEAWLSGACSRVTDCMRKQALRTVPLPSAALLCFIFPYNFPLLIWENLWPGCRTLVPGAR